MLLDLPVELAASILERLSLKDRARLSTVSKAWAAIAKQGWCDFDVDPSFSKLPEALDWVAEVIEDGTHPIRSLRIDKNYYSDIQGAF